MTLGAGIFLSAIVLAVVILFGLTKDRWNWSRITKWGLFAPTTFIVFVLLCFYAQSLWENRISPQNTFGEIDINAQPSEIKFLKGEPTSTDGPDRWIYNVGLGPAGSEDAQYLIQFKDGKIRFILYRAIDLQLTNPNLFGFTRGASYKEIEEKLGKPSHVEKSADDLSRIYSYEKLNSFFSFSQGRVVAYGLYQPITGPMKFRANEDGGKK